MAYESNISIEVNGVPQQRTVEVRRRLGDFLREDLKLTGTHLACEQGSCGACTVIVDGTPRLSCLTLAVQADGCSVRTVESLAQSGQLTALQQAFNEEHALQCGYCTSGFLMALTSLLERHPNATDDQIEEVIDGLICRCTGYLPILKAAISAREKLKNNQ